MQAFASRGLGKAFEANPEKRLPDVDSGFCHPRPRQSLIRVKIKGEPIGGFEVADHRAPGMDLEHVHLRQRDEA